MASMTDRKAQLVTLRAFVMLAVITVAVATFVSCGQPGKVDAFYLVDG